MQYDEYAGVCQVLANFCLRLWWIYICEIVHTIVQGVHTLIKLSRLE